MKGTQVIAVRVATDDPDLSKRMANEMATVYLEGFYRRVLRENKNVMEDYKRLLERIVGELEQAEKAAAVAQSKIDESDELKLAAEKAQQLVADKQMILDWLDEQVHADNVLVTRMPPKIIEIIEPATLPLRKR